MSVIKLHDFPSEPEQDQVYEIIPEKKRIVAYTNRLFNKYPTRYISAVPRFAIENYSALGDVVLDPFCGSGTTAIEAMLMGRNAVSIDIDPFSRLLINVKTHQYSVDELAQIQKIISLVKDNDRGKIEDYVLPQMSNIDKWFCEESQLGLAFIKRTIDENSTDSDPVRGFLYVVMAAIIRKSSNAEEVSPKPYISSRFPKTPSDPVLLFLKTSEEYTKAITEYSAVVAQYNCSSRLLESEDARVIDAGANVDLAVTSPPYINAYDYVRCLKFEDLWLGLIDERTLRTKKKKYVGTEAKSSFYENHDFASKSRILSEILPAISEIDEKRAGIVATYFEDMGINIKAVHGALKPGGRYVIVAGDSTIRKVAVPTIKILTEIAESCGFDFELSFKYVIRDRYLHLPRKNKGGIIKYDEILILKKR